MYTLINVTLILQVISCEFVLMEYPHFIYVKTETSTKDVPIFVQTFVAIDLKLSIRETVI